MASLIPYFECPGSQASGRAQRSVPTRMQAFITKLQAQIRLTISGLVLDVALEVSELADTNQHR